MDLRQLRYLVTVVKTGSFTAASHILHVSQPALGLQVKQLEDSLGTRLLVRHSRGVALTKAGSVFLRHATAILESVERAEQSLLPFKTDMRTEISFGVTPSVARTIIPELIEACARSETPSVRIIVQQGHSAELLEQVEPKGLDIAICYNQPKSHRLGSLPLYGEDLVLIGPPDLVKSEDGDVRFADLPKFPLIMSGTQRGARAFVEQIAAEQGVDLNIRHEVEAMGLKRELLLRNCCCTIVSLGVFLDDVRSGVFQSRRVVEPTLSRDFFLVFRHDLQVETLDFIQSSIRSIVEAKYRENQLGWHRRDREGRQNRPVNSAVGKTRRLKSLAVLTP
jgi:LysR family transcriptional regulator, nitrogen assimilation regulatory protein